MSKLSSWQIAGEYEEECHDCVNLKIDDNSTVWMIAVCWLA